MSSLLTQVLCTLINTVSTILSNTSVPRYRRTQYRDYILVLFFNGCRYSEPKHHLWILDFFEVPVVTWYDRKNKAAELVLDLLRLDVPYLFCESGRVSDISEVAHSFTEFLTAFIKKRHLENPLLGMMESVILVRNVNTSVITHCVVGQRDHTDTTYV